MTKGEDCTIGAQHSAEIQNLQRDAERLHAVDEQQWTAINTIRNRLPTWATLLISILMALLGILATMAMK